MNIGVIKNNIISFTGPKTYVVEQDHILMYHYNLSQIQIILDTHNDFLTNLHISSSDEKMIIYLKELTISQILSNKYKLNELIPPRIKRGLINIGGRISKILFGTLDDEDESLYQEYFQRIQGNMNTFETNQKRIISIIDSISIGFQNQTNIMVKQMNDFIKMEQVFDKIIIVQFEQIKISKILSEINTAVSFARLHLLHESILPLNYFKKYIQNNGLLKNLMYLKDFYSVCFTSVKIQDNQVIFVIKVPLVNPIPFNTYELYYVPYQNTNIIDQPKYLLIQEENIKWTLNDDCQQVEELMLCPQNKLLPASMCFSNFVKEKQENCARQSALEVKSDLIRLPNGNYISVFNDLLIENCSGQLSYEHEFQKILLVNTKCQISNGKKTFQPSKYNNLYHHFQLKDINVAEIQELIISPLNFTKPLELELYKWNIHPNHISTIYFVFVLFGLIIICFILYKMFIIKFSKLINKQSSSQKIELSSLKGEGNM